MANVFSKTDVDRIVGEIIGWEAYRYVSHALVAAVVRHALDIVNRDMVKGKDKNHE